MDFKLQDQVALVTGASRGLGKAIVFALAAEGCRLAIIARGRETLKETAEQLQLAGADVLAIPADVTVTADLERVVERMLAYYGRLDRKKTLPVLYALQQASSQGQAFLRTVYQQKEPLSPQQVARMLEILEQTQSRAFCQQYLAEQCQRAHEVLAGLPRVPAPIAQQAFSDLETLLFSIREDAGTP
jgi:geranylgeranyl pyrophosphate synthase